MNPLPRTDAKRAFRTRTSILFGERSLAEDLLQESFFRVYQHLDRYDAKRAFRTRTSILFTHPGLTWNQSPLKH